MCHTVSSYMGKNQPIWSANIAMNDTVAELDANNAALADKVRKQQTPTSGAADEKGQVKFDFEEKLLEIADQLSALADKRQDANLAAQVELTLSALDKLADDDLEAVGERVADLATADLPALADYDLTAADVAELNTLKTKFHGVKSGPRTAIAGRAGETGTLPEVLRRQMSLLRNRLDKQMRKFKKGSPEFYAGYRSARVIVDRGGSGGGGSSTPPPAPPTPSPANP